MLDPFLAQAALQRIQVGGNAPGAQAVRENSMETQGYWLFLGRFEPVKAPHLAIAAVGLAHRRGHRLKLRMVGQGSLQDQLLRQIDALQLGDAVTLESPVDHGALPELFSSALGLVLPSRAEGMSLTALEAGAFGLPIVAAESPGLRDAVRHGETGLLFKPDIAESLADCLIELQTSPDWRHRLGAAAREQALARTPNAAASAFAEALAQVGADISGASSESKKVIA
jgi:glycosyltransferase involved in cell wall biosynthesis